MYSHIKKISIVLVVAVSITGSATGQKKLSLQEAVELAIVNNPEIAATQLEVEKAKLQNTISRSLFLPSVNLAAQANHYFTVTPFFGFGESTAGGKIPYGRFGGEDQFATYISASQPLYNPQAFPTLQHSRLEEEESRLQLNSQRILTEASVKQTYLQVLVLQERIRLQHESINRNERVLRDAKSLFLQGKGLRVDTLRAYTSVKNLQPDLLKLTSVVETSKLQLKALIGIDTLQDVELTDSLFLPDASAIPSVDEVYELARNNNPQYQAIALQEELDEQRAHIASSARLPVVSAVAQYQLQTQTNNFEYGNAYYPSSSFVGLQVSVPLFTGLSNHAKVKQARISKQQTVLRSNYAFEQLRASVQRVVSESHESLARLQTALDVQNTAELSYNIIHYRYKKGVASRLELTDAELELSTAQSNYLEAVYDYLSARIALQQITGKSSM